MKKIFDVLASSGLLQGLFSETADTMMRIEWCGCGCGRNTVNFGKAESFSRTSLSDEEIMLLIDLLREFRRRKRQSCQPEPKEGKNHE